MVRSRIFRAVPALLVLSVLLAAGSAGGEQVAPKATKGVQYLMDFHLSGSFLDQPDKESSEFFRRIGRQFQQVRSHFQDGKAGIAGFAGTTSEKPMPFSPALQQDALSPEQKALCDSLRKETADVTAMLEKEFPFPASGLSVSGIVDPQQISMPNLDALEKDAATNREARLADRLRFMHEYIDVVVFRGSLSKQEFTFGVEILGGPNFKEVRAALTGSGAPLTLPQYLDPTSLFNFFQVQKAPDPEEVMAGLRQIPQTTIMEGFLASAGLTFEKDILPLSAEEIAVVGNLDPSGDGGMPDIRILGLVPKPDKLLAIAPALKQVATNLGVFVEISQDPILTAKVKYFFFPQIALHFTLVDRVLIVGTSRQLILQTAERINNVKNGKVQPYQIPAGLQRFWKVRFADFNEQLQKLLQSPLLADKGIPPITNLTMLKELGDLTVTSKTLEDRVVIRVSLPFSVK